MPSGDLAMIDYTLLVGLTKVDSLVGWHSIDYGADCKDPNLHGLCWGNYEATTCGMPVNTCSCNWTSDDAEGGPMTDHINFEYFAALTPDVV